ncbi:MAG: ferritin-like domain-containing protein [Solirubrobacteraceae bacterium]
MGALPAGGCTRRELLSGAIPSVGLGAATVSILTAVGVETASGQSETEAGSLTSVLEVELLVAFVYERVLGAQLLAVASARVAAGLLAHERVHIALLRGWLSTLGAPQTPALVDDRAADRSLASHHVSVRLAGLRTERDALRLLIAVEAVAVSAYGRLISALINPMLVRSAAEMLASEAQHATVLSGLLYPGDISRAVPDAFVTGRR